MFSGKTVFVSGGAGYIGSEICKAFKEKGADIIFSYNKNKEKAEELIKELGNATAIEMNLRDVNDITEKIEALYKERNSIDVLVNNAAISQIMPLAMLEEDDADLVFDVNIKGTLFLTKAVVRGMIRNKRGNVVNIGSIAGHRMLDVPITYAVSKAAIAGFTISLAAELKRFNIRVNNVVPGMLEGGVSKGVPDDLKELFVKHNAVGRAGNARDIAETVCFIASDNAKYINAQNIFVDGGI